MRLYRKKIFTDEILKSTILKLDTIINKKNYKNCLKIFQSSFQISICQNEDLF